MHQSKRHFTVRRNRESCDGIRTCEGMLSVRRRHTWSAVPAAPDVDAAAVAAEATCVAA